MKAEFIESIERVQLQTKCLGDSERKGERVWSMFGVWVFIQECGLLYVSSGIQEPVRTKRRARSYSLEPGALDLELSRPVVWNTHRIASAGYSHLVLP